MRITIRFGMGNELTKEFGGEPTVGFALEDLQVKADLGYGDNVEAHHDGIPQPNRLPLRDGMVIVRARNHRWCCGAGRTLFSSGRARYLDKNLPIFT